MDARRLALERAFRDYAQYEIGLEELARTLEPRAGFVVNSVQDPNLQDHAFNRVAELFLHSLNLTPGECPEELDIVLFLGSYDRGFGLHQDATDVTMLVLDGRKGFVVERGGSRQQFVLTAGTYLRWDASYAHSNCNADGDWSVTMNMVLGPSAKRGVAPGTPVEYIYPSVAFKDMCDTLSARRRAPTRHAARP